jgi:dienelactone hydrolase
MKIIIRILLPLCAVLIVGIGTFYYLQRNNPFVSPLVDKKETPKPLLAYSFEQLKRTQFLPSQITLGPLLKETEKIRSQMFYFTVPEKPNSTVMKNVSGVITAPIESGEYPIIVMFRGFIPEEIYEPGMGSQPSANQLAANGFITVAPDFLGFGESASPSAVLFEDRFQTYTTGLSLLASLPTLNEGLMASYSGTVRADTGHIGMWGHSNGGHIALSVLAVSGVTYPTVLWAPVSKSFPYSILYYTDEFDDQGKMLRKALSDFEKEYDTELFSPKNYFSWIKAPILVNQGQNDQEVPVWWSDELVGELKKDDIDVTYKIYPNADHNMLPDGWSKAVAGTIEFYREHFKK